MQHAHDAINSLKRIPKDDNQRKRAFTMVRDFLDYNPV
jgi:hypothetical protein